MTYHSISLNDHVRHPNWHNFGAVTGVVVSIGEGSCLVKLDQPLTRPTSNGEEPEILTHIACSTAALERHTQMANVD